MRAASSSHASSRMGCAENQLLLVRGASMVFLVLFLAAATVTAWCITARAASSSVESLSQTVRNHLLEQTAQKLHAVLEADKGCLQRTGTMLELTFATQASAAASLPSVLALLWQAFSFSPAAEGILFQYSDGRLVQYLQGDNSQGVFQIANPGPSAGNVLQSYGQLVDNSTGQVVGPPVEVQPRDFRGQSWYEQARASRETITWTLEESVIAAPALSLAKAVVNGSSGDMVGVLVTSTALSSFSSSLASLDLEGGKVFVMNEEGEVLASVEGVAGREAQTLLSPLVQGALRFLEEKYRSAGVTSGTHDSGVMLSGEAYFVDTVLYSFGSLRLVEVLLMPRASLMNRADYNSRISGLTSAAVAILLCLVGCMIILLVTRRGWFNRWCKSKSFQALEQEKCAEAERSTKNTFLARMSHEVRTPLTAIIGHVDLLLTDNLTPEQGATAAAAQSCAHSLLNLLNDMLDLGKMESGKLGLRFAELDLCCVLEDVVASYSVDAAQKGLEIVLDMPDDMERFVVGDTVRLRQIFDNLVSNAVKFTEPGGWVCVRARQLAEADLFRPQGNCLCAPPKAGMLALLRTWAQRSVTCFGSAECGPCGPKARYCFEVEDTGCGIPPGVKDAVFDNFTQADSSTTRTHTGSGLGLGIVRSLVRLMGGSVSIVDKAGPGALLRLELTLPTVESGKAAGEPLELPDDMLGVAMVLVMRGGLSRTVTARWLTQAGLSVHCAQTISQAALLAKALSSEATPSLVLPSHMRRTSSLPQLEISPSLGQLQGAGSSDLELVSAEEGSSPRGRGRHSQNDRQKDGFVLLVDAETAVECIPELVQQVTALCPAPRAVGWMVSADPTAASRKSLLEAGQSILVEKPLFSTRLVDVLCTLAEAMRNPETPAILSPSVIAPVESDRPVGSSIEGDDTTAPTPGGSHSSLTGEEIETSSTETPPSDPLSNGCLYREPSFAFDLKSPPVSPAKKGKAPRCSHELIQGRLDEAFYLPRRLRGGSNARALKVPDVKPCNTPSSSSSTPYNCWSSDNPYNSSASDTKASSSTNTWRNNNDYRSSSTSGAPLSDGTTPTSSASSTPPGTPPPGWESPYGREDLRGKYILLAEDTPLLRRLGEKMLKKVGAEVVGVPDGAAAVAAWLKGMEGSKRRPFDCILMDCQMPKLDGYGATQAIRELEKKWRTRTPIIALTAHAMESDRERCLSIGMDEYLTKPHNLKLIVSTILEKTAKSPWKALPLDKEESALSLGAVSYRSG